MPQDRGRGHAQPDADAQRLVVRRAGRRERLVHDGLQGPGRAQAAQALGEADPGEAGVEAGPQEVESLGGPRVVARQEFADPVA